MGRLVRGLRDGVELPRDLLLGRYPEFVTGGTLPPGQVPVFVFHSLEPESFGRKVRHLAENGYQTLSGDDYIRYLTGAAPAPERAVLLTFDDGRASVRTVGLPVMARYGARGLVFLVPGRVASRPGPLPPTWEDVETGTARAEDVLARDTGEDAFLTWEEIESLRASGLFEFHSHTLFHSRVHTAPRLSGFMHPGLRRGYLAMDVPLVRDKEKDLLAPEIPLGTPLLRSEPRTSEALRFFEDGASREACRALVEGGGGERFFLGKGWEKTLRSCVRSPIRGRFETPEERAQAIRRELAESRRLIEERTSSRVAHLCYPWHASGATARRLAQEAGYATAFCGKVNGVPITLPGGDPLAIARVGEDWIECLPGRGRVTLRAILGRKWSRRLKAG